MTETSDTEKAKVSDDHFAILQKDILALEIFVHNPFGMQIPHALHVYILSVKQNVQKVSTLT
jgi:hypothetical protein